MAGRTKFARLTVLVLLLTSFWSTAAAAMQIGFVDYEFLFSAHPEYPLKNQEYQQAVLEYNSEFEQKMEQAADENEISELYAYYSSLVAQFEEDLRIYILNSLNQHIAKVAQEQQIDVVLVNTMVIYGGVDLTKSVVEEMYRAYGISVPSYIRQHFE